MKIKLIRPNNKTVMQLTQTSIYITSDGCNFMLTCNRNYFKCSVEGCPVKKRVERDGEDPRYVITTYESVHNHPGSSTC